MALISYTDEDGLQQTQVALVGDNTVLLLNGANFGVSTTRQPEGVAKKWLKDEVFKALGKKAV